MKTKWFAAVVAASLTIAPLGCSSSGPVNKASRISVSAGESSSTQSSLTGIAGLHLSDSRDDAVRILGNDYRETLIEEPGYFGEPQYKLTFKQGAEVLIGKSSKKILSLRVFAEGFATDLGSKVGDPAAAVLDKYRVKYKEYRGANSDATNTGWFRVDNDTLVIFDFDKSDSSKINRKTDAASKVEAIELAYIRNLD